MDNIYKFTINNITYEIFFAEDGFIEIYEIKNPSHSGFYFKERKNFTMFINNITDIVEKRTSMEAKSET